MEHTHSEERRIQWPGSLVIARDVLIFLVCILTVALIYLVSSRALPAEAAGGTTATASVDENLQSAAVSKASQTVPLQVDTSSSESDSAKEAESSFLPEPTPLPVSDPSASNGDFSAVFPTADTGTNALFSYQSDTTKIAITKIQKNDVTYFVADVWVKTIDAFHTALADGTYGRGFHEMPLKIASENQAVFAVSGDYYGAREQGVVVRDGVLYRDVMGDDVCILKKDGTLNVYQKGSFSALDMLDSSVWQAWAFGPALVENGKVCDTSSSKIKVKNPRSAIGYYEPGHYCFIVVDGRQSGYSVGMSLDELAGTFAALGCVTAYNLDGGATATMVFQGAVVNQPTNGGRSSSDIIYF